MNPTTFPQANVRFGAPEGMAELQVMTIPAFIGESKSGSCDGATIVVVAWQPTPDEIALISVGKPIFLTCLGALPPHFMSLDFQTAITPA